jgi:hypothetical protein
MPIDLTNFSTVLQTRLNAATNSTSATELLLLAKTQESSIGNATVTEITNLATAKVSEMNTLATTKLTEMNTAATTKLTEMNSTASTKLSEMTTAATNHVTSINNAGAAWFDGSQPIPAAVVAQIRGPAGANGAQGPQGPVGATFSVSGSTLTINW